jgi:hypothetical protein
MLELQFLEHLNDHSKNVSIGDGTFQLPFSFHTGLRTKVGVSAPTILEEKYITSPG